MVSISYEKAFSLIHLSKILKNFGPKWHSDLEYSKLVTFLFEK